MAPNRSSDGPARWKLIEATNGYDVDNGWYQDPRPAASVRPPGGRGVHPGLALARFLLSLPAAQRRRRKRPVGRAGARITPAPRAGEDSLG